MEKSAILNADLLDIVFEGRNKEYGAYELRRSYNKRLRVSIAVMMSLALMLCIGQLIAGRLPDKKTAVAMLPTDLELENIDQPENEPPPVPPPPAPPPPQVQSVQYTAPLIVDEDVPEDEMPPEIPDLEDAKIDVVTQEGEKDAGIVAPPEDEGRGIIEEPKPKERDPNEPRIDVQQQSDYPGGMSAWQRFLTRNLRIPQVVIDNRINGTVIVQFVVDREGNVSNVVALSGPMELRDEAVRVIKKSGKWIPAMQNGINVASYKKQPIVVRIEEE
jgi:periplasmic protein TonB